MDTGRAMMRLLRHRGPDAEGCEVSAATIVSERVSAFIAQRRLKIIDLSDAARNPLPNEDGTVQVTFNGEIYNFRELRYTLQQRGHVFRSRSDTETIVHAYEEYGEDCVSHLDGMFAFAIWDARTGSLFIARDRSGKKPLFYAWDGRYFSFASEIKAILVCPWVSRAIDHSRIPEYLTYGYIPTPSTFFKEVVQLPPASWLRIDRGKITGPVSYWDVGRFLQPGGTPVPSRNPAAQLRGLLTAAVERRLVSDVPLGALLSGGLDSTIVVALASRLLPEPLRTFTVGFADDPSYDERADARLAARHFHTHHTDCVLRADMTSLIEPLVWHHDQPYGDSSAVATYLVSRVARQQVTVALNGDGGDEIFGGYDRFVAALVAERIPWALFGPLKTLTAWLPAGNQYYSLARRVRRFAEQGTDTIEDRFLGWISIFNRDTLESVLGSGLPAIDPGRKVREHLGALPDAPLLNRLLFANFVTYLPDDLHTKMDRMSMAVGLETRSPFLDTAVVEFVMGLSPDHKIRGLRTKQLLRETFRSDMPPQLLRKRKHGFNVPLRRWLRAELKDYLQDHLLDPAAEINRLLDQAAVRRMVGEHLGGTCDHSYRLWTLLNLEVWLRMVRDGALWRERSTDGITLDITELRTELYA